MLRKILHYLNLDSEVEDLDKIHQTIEKDIVFKGTNLWILVFAIVIASVGLNMNSTAVIIGAMLISPLMGPINGMGYSIATYNFHLLGLSIKNFSFAVIASLLASSAYFYISPISTEQSELLARTSPTIYDVMIALFGGLAGILAISSKHKGNVIPGVAIATALMPPLCTAGYGLATGKINFFFGALYLFTINTVFIAFSSVIISQILKFPIRTIVDEKQKKKVNAWISAIILLTLIPSIYFGYGLVQKEKFFERATKFVSSISLFQGNYLLSSSINPASETISLIYGGRELNDSLKFLIKKEVENFNIKNAEFNIKQGLTLQDLKSEASEKEKFRSELSRLTRLVVSMKEFQDSLSNNHQGNRQILNEMKALFPNTSSFALVEALIFNATKSDSQKVSLALVQSDKKRLLNSEKKRMSDWLKTRISADSLLIIFN